MHRWEREVIRDTWNNYKGYKTDKGEPVHNIDYITNTTRAEEEKINFERNNAKIIRELERAAQGWDKGKQYRAAWYTIRGDLRERYGKESEIWKVGGRQFDIEDTMIAWLVEMEYPGIKEGTNTIWNKLWEKKKRVKRQPYRGKITAQELPKEKEVMEAMEKGRKG